MTVEAASPQIPDDLLAHASDVELNAYLEYLRLEQVAADREWVLQPRQARAEQLADETDVFELLYGGAAGGGKSEWLLYHMYHLAVRYPRFKGLLLRRTFPELRRSLIVRSWEKFDREGLSELSRKVSCKYLAAEHIWRFSNGSSIEFGYVETDSDAYQYQSAEYAAIGFDELTQWATDFPYLYLMSRCRVTVDLSAMGLRPHMVAGTNPGGVGGAWVKERFVDIGPPGRLYPIQIAVGGGTRTVTRAFIPARRTDNRYLGEEYAIALANLPEAIRAALEDGSWEHVEGQYFTEWDRRTHVVEPFEIPVHWRRIRGLDYGYTAPMCCLWGAFDGDGNLYIYRELYGTEMLPKEQATRIVAMSRSNGRPEQIDYTVADPSIWSRTGAGPPIAQQYADAGLATRKANNARRDGWARVREYLRVDPRTKRPQMFVFTNCANLIRFLPMQVHDHRDPEDLDTRGEDHACDALRYLCMSRPLRTKEPGGGPSTREDRMWARVRKKKHRKQSNSPIGDI